MEAPTAAELLNHPAVQHELERAWADSLAENEVQRHEEGGWIYMNSTTGAITVVRAEPGQRATIDLSDPPHVEGSVVVGKFHTHPNPTSEGWIGGPSDGDLRVDALHGVPDLIRADDGIHLSGPNCRRGGLYGPAGYPH